VRLFDLPANQPDPVRGRVCAPDAPIVAHNAGSTGTDVVGYLTELFGFSTFVCEDGSLYHTYSTTGRGVEFLMGYYPILDRAPKGRDEGDAWQVWIRRHDEYDSE
jgi:predicted dithiol-disulfide oxidoreductase (DUF899 family)